MPVSGSFRSQHHPASIGAGAKPDALPALTTIRFAFAFVVVLFHLIPFMHSIGYVGLPEPFRAIVYHGYLGVDFFFVLSGFILVYSCQHRLFDPSADRAFWVARFARLYPGYCVGLALSMPLALYAAFLADDRAAALRELGLISLFTALLLHAWLPAAALALNGPAWSVSTEAFFYSTFPRVFRAMARQSTLALSGFAVALYLLAIMLGQYFWLYPADLADALSNMLRFPPRYPESSDIFYMYFPLVRWPEFLIGCVAGFVFIRHRVFIAAARSIFLALALVGLGLVLYGVAQHLPQSTLSNGLLAPLVVLLLFGLADSRSRVLSHSLGRKLGEASYALYILHAPIWMLMSRADLHFGKLQWSHPVAFTLAYLVVAVAASLLSLTLVEAPARRWLRRTLTKREPRSRLAEAQ